MGKAVDMLLYRLGSGRLPSWQGTCVLFWHHVDTWEPSLQHFSLSIKILSKNMNYVTLCYKYRSRQNSQAGLDMSWPGQPSHTGCTQLQQPMPMAKARARDPHSVH